MKRSLKNIIIIFIIIAVGVCSYFTMKDTQGNNISNKGNQILQEGPGAKGENQGEPSPMPSENFDNSNRTIGEPPAKPNGRDENDNGKFQTPKDMPIMNEQNSRGIKTIHYIMFGMEGFIISILTIYLVMSKFNKLTMKETLKGKNRVIIFTLSLIIITTLLTLVQICITDNVFVIKNMNEQNMPEMIPDANMNPPSSSTTKVVNNEANGTTEMLTEDDTTNSAVISINDDEITVNGETIATNTDESVYLTNKMNNGGTSTDATSSNIEIDNIININSAGTYEFSGTLSNGQISINANDITGNVRIKLNNVDITCKNAPAIFVYSKNVENENCKVTIEVQNGTTNNIIGGKIKQSVEGWEDQDDVLYFIDKGYDDDKQYYERYKYDGAISSDVSLTFEGTGILNVTSSKKEGIESKMNITINEGTYNIASLDDGINACTENKSIITINDGTVIVNILDEAEEGDGIDSNGYLYINGGTVCAFAHPGSDNGLDSDLGTYINGGTVLSTGSMYEEFKTSNNTKIVQMNLSKEVNEDESIVIADEDNNVVFAFKTDRKISTFAYSSNNLSNETYSIYSGTSIQGTLDSNNIYTNISSIDLSQMTKQASNNMMGRGEGIPVDFMSKETNSIMPNTIVGKVIVFVLIIIIVLIISVSIFTLARDKN